MSASPKLLDLFCGPGGAGHGYELAGFQVWGVDVKRQRPPYMFTQAEALDYLDAGGAEGFHAIHASPPCQLHSPITVVSGNPEEHPDLIGPVRERLHAIGLPFVIENVPRAPLVDPELMCGAAVGLRLGRCILRRHRLFESNVSLKGSGCACRRGDGVSIGIYGGGSRQKPRRDGGGGDTRKANLVEARLLMGMPWANRTEIAQAIPPAYTAALGRQLIERV